MLVWVCFSCSQCIICMRISTLTSANWYVPLSVTSNLSAAGQTPSMVQVPSKSNIPNAITTTYHQFQPTADGVLNSRHPFYSSQPLEELYWSKHFTLFLSTWAGFANMEKIRIVEPSLKIERVGCPRLRYYLVRMKRVFSVFRESVISKLYNEWESNFNYWYSSCTAFEPSYMPSSKSGFLK